MATTATSKKQRRKVLPEEDYQSTLSSIVQRDYFPDLPELQKQAGVLSCREAKDFKGAVAIRRAARRLQDHEAALAEQEEQEDGVDLRKLARPLHRETVTGFHARATSEDNQEFETNRKEEAEARTSRIEAVYRNYPALTNSATVDVRGGGVGSETPLLASDLFNPPSHFIEAPKNPKVDNGFFFAPELKPHTDESSGTKLLTQDDTNLMPPPRAKNSMVVAKQDLVEYIPKHALEKRIEPSQTRFQVVPRQQRQVVVPSSHDDSTDYSTEASTDLDEPSKSVHLERNQRIKRQKRELETLVTMTPLIEPRSGEASPITTWGTVSSTPMVLGKDAESRAFALPKESTRDKAAKAAEELVAKRRNSVQRTPNSRHRKSNLTPAAQSLLRKSMPRSSVRSSGALSTALRKSYTPKSSMWRKSSHAATPKASRETTARPSIAVQADKLTEGLLDLSGQRS